MSIFQHRAIRDDEQRRPFGAGGLRAIHTRGDLDAYRHDLSDCLVLRPKPFRLVIFEPLRTKAPSPALALPHCCYIQTVIFYHRPYIQRPWKTRWRSNGRLQACDAGFEEWGKVETRLSWEDTVNFEDEDFKVGGGRVIWGAAPNGSRRWWMAHAARRVPA